MTTDRPSPARIWWLAIRPATLPAAVAPVLVGLGAALGGGAAFRVDTAVACLAVALLLQVAANLANDLSDFHRGADTPDRTGPLRVAAAGLVSSRDLQVAIAIALGLAGVVGLYLVSVGGVVLLGLGALAMVATLAYTGGPWPYGYRGLGEVFVFAFFGLVAVVGTAYLQAGRLEPLFWLAAIPVGSLITGILVVNNLRDIPTDRAAAKWTLAVTFGEGFAKAEYLVLLGLAAAIPIVLFVTGRSGLAIILPLGAMGLAWVPARRVARFRDGDDRRALNLVLKATARLSLVYGAFFAVGLALGRVA
ncbi:MAG: 1,4-dihydroxy-2-naphthoate polyprenyltransferase [Candidatus Limnocylindrales bacterium]